MLVQNSVYRNTYLTDGVNKDFYFSFPILESSQVLVQTSLLTDTETVTTVDPGQYTVIGVGQTTGGHISFTTAPPTGSRIALTLNMPITQLYQYAELDSFPAKSHENALAKLTLICQQLKEQLERAVRLPSTSSESPETVVASIYASRDAAAASASAASNKADAAEVSAQAAANSASTAAQTVETAAAGAVSAATAQANAAANSASTAAQTVETAAAGAVSAATAQANAAHDSALAAAQSAADAAAAVPDNLVPRVTAVENIVTALIGSVLSIMATDTYVPNGCVPCNGAEYTRAQFPALYDTYLAGGKLLTCTYAEFSNQVAGTGNCAKFALDTANQKFKVPMLKDGDSITQATSAAELGRSYKAGLPNITGTVYVQGLTYGSAIISSGALSASDSGRGNGVSSVAAPNGCSTIGLNAAASSPIYGNATTVRDEQVRLRHFVVVASAQNNASVFDWSNYMAGLAGKASIDFNNITLTGKANAGKAMAYALDYEHPVTFALGDTWTYAPVGGLMVGWVWMDTAAPTDSGVVTVGSTNVAGTKKNTTVNTLSCFIDTGVRAKKVAGMHAEDVVIVPWRTA